MVEAIGCVYVPGVGDWGGEGWGYWLSSQVMRISDKKAMAFLFLEFWVPSFFRSKLKGSNTWLAYFGIYRLRSDCIFKTEGGFKIGTLSFRTFVLSVLL